MASAVADTLAGGGVLLAEAAAPAAEDGVEEIREVAFEVVAARAAGALPARRRFETAAARAAPAGAILSQLIVFRAPVRILKDLVRFGDFLELFFRAFLGIHVRVILARKLAVSRLDIFRLRVRLHAEYLVVVLEFHSAFNPENLSRRSTRRTL